MNCWWFLKNLNHCLKNVYQKPLSFLELLYKKKEKNPNDFPIVDSYFFHNFLDVFIVRNRVIWLSECLFRETYSIKDFTFDPHIAYQSFKLTAELHLTKKQILFILENLKLIKKSYNNISKTLSIPYSKPKIVKIPQQSSILLHFLRIFKVQNPAWFGLESNFQMFALKNLSTMSYPPKFTFKLQKLTMYSKISNFSLITYKKFN